MQLKLIKSMGIKENDISNLFGNSKEYQINIVYVSEVINQIKRKLLDEIKTLTVVKKSKSDLEKLENIISYENNASRLKKVSSVLSVIESKTLSLDQTIMQKIICDGEKNVSSDCCVKAIYEDVISLGGDE